MSEIHDEKLAEEFFPIVQQASGWPAIADESRAWLAARDYVTAQRVAGDEIARSLDDYSHAGIAKLESWLKAGNGPDAYPSADTTEDEGASE